MSAPRLDLGEMKERLDAAPFDPAPSRFEWESLIAIAEAAEAFMSEEHDCDDDQPCLYHDALSAALAAVRKEEKGD